MSFRYLEPELYKKIASMLDEKRDERECFIADAVAALAAELRAAGHRRRSAAAGPSTSTASTTRCAARRLDFAELYDVRALRVLVDSVKDCYTALGVVHNLWTPIPKEFDDYISRPKGNDYRSLHTAVIGADGRALEVQIRTHEMHRHAELGVAAHWRYKEAGAGRPAAQAGPVRREDRLAAAGARLARRRGRVRRLGRAVQADGARRHGLRADAAGQGARSAAGCDAGGFRLPPAYRSRPSLPRRQGRWRHGAPQLQARQRPAGGDRRRPRPAVRAATG